jgi:CDP-glycerol glycerophosphotransferase (TagB/SpsB family)
MTFPRLTTYTAAPVDPEIQLRRETFAAKLAERRGVTAKTEPEDAGAIAEAFGRRMFDLCGKGWPAMIGLASGAAMTAERDAMGDVQ